MLASDVGASRALPRRPALMLLLAVLTAFVFTPKGFAAEPGDVTSGALMMRARGGDQVVEAVRLGTDIDMTVSALTVRTRVTQAFRNDSNRWVEAVYVYPLP